MENVRIVDFNSTIDYGQMSLKFIDNNLDREDRLSILHSNKNRIASEFGLNYKKLFIADQKNNKTSDLYEDGKCYLLSSEDIAQYDDLYDLDVYADITKINSEAKNVAICYPVADCAVVKAINTKTNEIVLSHCGGEYIDRYLPMQTIDALGGSEKDILVYISPFAYNLFYPDVNKLIWANNPKVWEGCKKEVDGSITVNVYKALKRQLLDRKIPESNLYISSFDTIASKLFYSNSKSHTDDNFSGRFISGIAVVDDNKKIKTNKLIKVIK